MSSPPFPSPSENSLKEPSQEKSEESSNSLRPLSKQEEKAFRYRTRNGRSWYRKSDPPPQQKLGSDMLIGIQAIAKFMGISYFTARKLIRFYGLPAVPFGGCAYRIHPESIFTWLEAYSSVYQDELTEAKRQCLEQKTNN